MKKLVLFQILFLVGMLLPACGGTRSAASDAKEAGDFANWEAWSITWQAANTFDDVTVKIDDMQKTYLPEQENYVFVALMAEFLNISQETQEMRFWQGPIYLTDQDQNVYDLVGIANRDVILMAPPYLLEDATRFRTGRWDDGRFITVAYQADPQSWFLQATPNSVFHVDFLFTVPRGVSGFVLQFGNGMIVKIGQ
jgi:hypothetical protein